MGCGSSRSVNSNEIVCGKEFVYLEREANLKYSIGFSAEAKGASDAVILLCDAREEPHFRVSLGADGNRWVRASCQKNSELLAEVEAARIVDPGAYRGFWVTWRGGSLSVGRGYRHGHQELLSFPMEGEEAEFRPYCIRVACEAAGGGSVAWRSVKLLYED